MIWLFALCFLCVVNVEAQFDGAANNNRRQLLTTSNFSIASISYSYPLNFAVDGYQNAWVTSDLNFNNGFVQKINSTGSTLGRFTVGSQPEGIAIDSSGNVWVANSDGSGSVSKLSNSGNTLGTFSVDIYPIGVAIDSSDNVWVWFSANGNDNLPGKVTKLSGSTGSKIGTFNVSSGPTAMAFDSNGNAWVVCNAYSLSANGTVTKLSSSGSTLGTFTVGVYPMAIG